LLSTTSAPSTCQSSLLPHDDTMTKPSTIAAISVLVCVPALISFASGQMSPVALGLWYLVALVVVAVGAHILAAVFSRYAREAAERASRRTLGTSDEA
jgi:uncharacterized membrane protein (DUF485 family)